MRIGFLSDLHLGNNTAMKSQAIDVVLSAAKDSQVDKLFIAGDTSNNYKMTLEFVDELNNQGLETYVIFGNHEYWSIEYPDEEVVHNKYINGRAVKLTDDDVLVAIDGFFDYSFVKEVDNRFNDKINNDKYVLNHMGKKHFDLKRNQIRYKDYEEVFEEMMDNLVGMLEKYEDKNIIMMLHYVPSAEFITYIDDYVWLSNNSFMGSIRYQEVAEEYKVDKVIFGHTHYTFNETINGVDYHCNPVGYKGMEFQESFRERVYNQLLVFDL